MSSDYDIEMTTDDTLELDSIIQEWNPSNDVITEVKHTGDTTSHKNELRGIQTNTAIFDPPKSGIYNITINGQELKVNVIDASSIPSNVVDDFEDNDLAGWSEAIDGRVGGIRDTTTAYNGNYAGEVYTNSSGSRVINYYDTSLDASNSSVVTSSYVRWEQSYKTTICFGFVNGNKPGEFVGIGTGSKNGYKWVLFENDYENSRNYIETSSNNLLTVGNWYEAELSIDSNNNVEGTIYDLDGSSRSGSRVSFSGQESTLSSLSSLKPATLIFANNAGSNYQMLIDDIRI